MSQTDYGASRLDEKRIKIWGEKRDVLGLRMRRCVSWLQSAEVAGNHDATFISLWISFNAAYSKQVLGEASPTSYANTRSQFDEYFAQLVQLDEKKHIYNTIWEKFSNSIRVFINNKYTFHPFWQNENGVAGYENWEDRFDASKKAFINAIESQNTEKVLSLLFDRLYVLRNQLMHGGATWQGSINRSQVDDGTRILGFLVPIFIEIMLDNRNVDWGMPYYLPVEE